MSLPTSSNQPGCHHVFTRWRGDLWIGVRVAAERIGELARDREYTVLTATGTDPLCVSMPAPDGRTFCDYGPEHNHG